ncbi:MAG: 30S ribosomal protein S15 [candidate division Zixibacteria bacterium]|nr:30S ribosomal protein S15 [candidate division Zixibacteria bacterium]NIR63731.1 30S ribosomal protein S15 [candidate division Zixibacteria bacterium]NIS14688.1 30S ribosomal protein S15 [candidate division Zixibacteria bacterium]NIS45687.1 30S ribosomal protein S15 [candidate division Zixibacteria bacterium]NIT51216.1 30S ribosomal protein S15 [candidate division Zixibacteria bacterium]
MALSSEKKEQIIEHFKLHDKDTGSPEVQIALLSQRINELTLHMHHHPKDFHSRFGLIKLVGQRKKLLNYLRDNDLDAYRELIQKLDLRG